MTVVEKAKTYVDLARPFTLVPPPVGVLAGALMALGFYGRITLSPFSIAWSELRIPQLLIAVLMYAPLNAASNSINQVSDAHVDAINKSFRPIPSGRLSVKEVTGFYVLSYSVAIFAAVFVSPWYLFWVLVWTLVTVIYSTPGTYLKKRFVVNTAAIAFCQSWVLLMSGWSVYPFASQAEPFAWFAGLVLFVYLFGATATKDFTEVEGDGAYGMKTFPVLYGKEKAARIIRPFFVAPFALLPVGVLLDIAPWQVLLALPLAAWGLWVFYNMEKKLIEPRNSSENSPSWLHYYLLFMALALVMGGSTIF